MSLYDTYATDTNAEINGITYREPGGDNGEFIELKLARAGGANTKFGKVFQAKFGPYMKSLNRMDPKLGARLLAEVYAEAVVLGWANVTGRDGAPMDFTKENVVKLFTDLPEFFNRVQSVAGDMEMFRAEVLEKTSGN